MARLLLINGLPGSGKSTLAARYVADRPLTLCLAADVGAEFVEVVLVQDPDVAAARLAERAAGPLTEVQRDAHRMLDRAGGLGTVPDLHRRLHTVLVGRALTKRIEPVPGDVEATYRSLLAVF